VAEICARLAGNFCQYMTTVSCWANSLVRVSVCYSISQLASRVGEGGGVWKLCLHSVTQPYTTWPRWLEQGGGLCSLPLRQICNLACSYFFHKWLELHNITGNVERCNEKCGQVPYIRVNFEQPWQLTKKQNLLENRPIGKKRVSKCSNQREARIQPEKIMLNILWPPVKFLENKYYSLICFLNRAAETGISMTHHQRPFLNQQWLKTIQFCQNVLILSRVPVPLTKSRLTRGGGQIFRKCRRKHFSPDFPPYPRS
jgi:hypothetical protein